MATVHPLSGPPPSGGSASRGPTYQVTTRELSADFSTVGPEEETRDLGAVDAGKFRQLLEQLAAIEPVKLVDADPQLIVGVRNGRFLIQPQGGKLLVRPANALDQMFFKLTPAEIPSFLDGSAPSPPQTPTTLIGSAAARAEAEAGAAPTPPSAAGAKRATPPAKTSRGPVLLGSVALGVALVAAAGWFFLKPAPAKKPAASSPPAAAKPAPVATASTSPAAPPASPVPEFDPITAPEELSGLQRRFAGTYVTGGDAGERLFELRTDGTFHYQEFGAGLAVTSHDNGAYAFVRRPGTATALLRAGNLGAIELTDETALVIRGMKFTRLPAPPK